MGVGEGIRGDRLWALGSGLWALGYGQWNSSKAKEGQGMDPSRDEGDGGDKGRLWAMEQFKGQGRAGDGS